MEIIYCYSLLRLCLPSTSTLTAAAAAPTTTATTTTSSREELRGKDNLIDQVNQDKARLVQGLKTAEGSVLQLKAKLGLMASQLEAEKEAMDKIQMETKGE